jgi:hypothetical protein
MPVTERFDVGYDRRLAGSTVLVLPLVAWWCARLAQGCADRLFDGVEPVHNAVYGVVLLVIAGACLGVTAHFMRALVQRRPVLTVTREVLHDRRLTAQPLPWSAILAVRPYRVLGRLWLAIELVRPGTGAAVAPTVYLSGRVGAALRGRPPLAVNLATLDAPPEQVLALLRRWVPGKVLPE